MPLCMQKFLLFIYVSVASNLQDTIELESSMTSSSSSPLCIDPRVLRKGFDEDIPGLSASAHCPVLGLRYFPSTARRSFTDVELSKTLIWI